MGRTGKPRSGPLTYEAAPDVAQIGKELIADHHMRLENLQHRIVYVWRSKAAKKGAQTVLGSARVVRGLPQWLAGADESFYLIQIARDTWRDLDDDQRRALVDHELYHCGGLDEKGEKLTLDPHDVQEFASVLERWGVWKQDLKRFVRVAQQLTLDEAANGEGAEE